MNKVYDDILFDEYGDSIPLSSDDLIEYLLDSLHQLRTERDLWAEQLAAIQLILSPKGQEYEI